MYNIIKVEKVDSTNKFALEKVDFSSTEEFSVVWALEQYAGKGQLSASWESEPFKNLTFSLILYPKFLSPSEQFKITQAVSIGVAEYLQTILPDQEVTIKWPNDIYVDKKKICGILSHNRIVGSVLAVCVVGIGLNINQNIFRSDAPNPISLKQLTQKKYILDDELDKLLGKIEQNYNLLKSGNMEGIHATYRNLLLNYNKTASYKYSGKKIQAKIIGVNEFGHLQLQCASDETIECAMKEIKYLF